MNKTTGRKTSTKNLLYSRGYGEKWTDIYVHKSEKHEATLIDFHEHQFYEINLILSGNVKVIVGNTTIDSTENKIILTKPNEPHFVSSKPDVLYSSLFLIFTEEFIKSYDIQSINLLSVFGEKGAAYTLNQKQTDVCANILETIKKEENTLRKKFLVFYLLSYISDFSKQQTVCTTTIPEPIFEALSYINKHYTEKITAQELANKVYMGRTTLMTQFKKYTGKTVHEYMNNCRLREAIKLLLEGKTEYEAAINSGFSDSSSLVQSFKRIFKMTPRKYIEKVKIVIE